MRMLKFVTSFFSAWTGLIMPSRVRRGWFSVMRRGRARGQIRPKRRIAPVEVWGGVRVAREGVIYFFFVNLELFEFDCPKVGVPVEGETVNPHPRYADPKDCQSFYVCIDGKVPRKGEFFGF